SVAVSIVLAVAHSLSIGLLYLLAWRLFARLRGRDRAILSILATALGASTAVYWETVGSSFLDPLLVPPMLAGLLLLVDESPRAARRALAAGALFGAAAALKYSNAIYVLAALPLALAMPVLSGVARLRACLAYLAGGAALLAAAVALPVVAARRNAPPQSALRGDDWRVLAFFAASLVLWLASSANARYGLIVLLIAGVALARIAERLLPAGIARTALAMLLVVQLGTSVMASPPRWFIAEPWSLHWLPYDVPERALREPALYVTVEVLPMAVIAPFVHPASSFVNFR